MNHYQIDPIAEGVWSIGESMVRMFLIDGGRHSVLIDTGCAAGNLEETVHSLVDGAVTVINTHSHGDHTLGNKYFKDFCVHEGDREDIEVQCPENSKITVIKDGDILTIGNVELEVIGIPGHTPGSIALLNKEKRVLFTSDMFAKNFPIYMQYPGQDLKQYHQSMMKLINRMDEFDTICPCHGELAITKEDMSHVQECCEGILNGTISGEMTTLYDGSKTRIFRYKDISIYH